jgi:hypothetical protein
VATSTQVVPEVRARGVLALWHLLSLDAPTVAVVWTWFVARAEHVRLGWASLAAMGIAVWMLYVADRLLDARVLDGGAGRFGALANLEERHLFHYRHRRGFLLGIGVAGVGLAVLLPRLDGGAIRLYLSEGALLFGWFVILHGVLRGRGSARRLPKEIAVGLFFAAAIFIPTVAREPGLRIRLAPVAIVLAGVCSLNCLFIYRWESNSRKWENKSENWENRDDDWVGEAHPSTRWAVRHLGALAMVEAMAGVGLGAFDPGAPGVLGWACGLACVVLVGLDRWRGRISPIRLRAAADLALLTPLIFLGFIR